MIREPQSIRTRLTPVLGAFALLMSGCDFVESFKKGDQAKEYDAYLASQVRDSCGLRGYYTFVYGALKQNCASCHGGLGPGTGSFGSFELPMSYVSAKSRVSFPSTGRSLLVTRSANTGHCPTCGAQWAETLRASLSEWALAESDDPNVCRTLSEISDETFQFGDYTPPDEVVVTVVPEGLAAFSRPSGLHSELQNACSECHVPGKVASFAAFAQTDATASYRAAKPRVDFFEVTSSMLYQNASESNHGDSGCDLCGNSALLARLETLLLEWREEEDQGSQNLKTILADEIVSLPTLNRVQTLNWDLGAIDARFSGAIFRARVERTSSNPTDYRVLDIRLVNQSSRSIRIRNILPRVQGTEDRLLSTYAVVNMEVTPGSDELLSSRPIWIPYPSSGSARLGWSIEELR